MGNDSSAIHNESIEDSKNDDAKQMSEKVEIQLIESKKDIKRHSNQSLQLFKKDNINIHTMTYANTNHSKQYVLDIVALLDKKGQNTNKSLIIVMSGITDIAAYIIDKHNLNKSIYFKQKYDMSMKIKMMTTMMRFENRNQMVINNIINSITIHPNNTYIAMTYDQVVKIFKMCIDYKEMHSILLQHYTNIISDHNNLVLSSGNHFDKVIFLGNELILIQNTKSKNIIIYNFIKNKLLYKYDAEYINIQYDNYRKYITVLKDDSSVEMYDISASTNNKFNVKRVFLCKQFNCISDYYFKKIEIISISPNGKYILTSPRLINEQYDSEKRLIKPFDIYEINKSQIKHCNIRHFGKIQKRMKIVEHFGPNSNVHLSDNEDGQYSEELLEIYDYKHVTDEIEYDSDVSSRYGDFQESYNFDHVSFEWITDNIFVYIIDELEEHPHFGELLIVGLNVFEMSVEQKQSIVDIAKEKYNNFVHNGIIEFIATFLNGIDYFQKFHICDYGYRHSKKRIVCDRVNKCFGVYGWDKSLRFHSLSFDYE